MPSESFTVTPAVYTDESTGNIIYDTENATIESSAYKEEINAANNRGELQEIIINDESGEPETITPLDNNDATFLTDTIFGGLDNYRAQLQWAGENLTQEDCDEFDAAVSSGDVMTCKHYMEQLAAKYQEAQQFDSRTDDWRNYFYSEIASEEEYGRIQEFAQENLDEDEIVQLNELVEKEDYKEFEHRIRNLQRRMEIVNSSRY